MRPRNSTIRGPALSPAYNPYTELITPAPPGTEMSLAGARKFGWLKIFPTSPISSKWSFSVIGKRLASVTLCTCKPGPSRIFTPLLPNLPAGGFTKQDVSNQWFTVRWPDGRLPLQMRSGSPPNVLVLDGSALSNDGVKNWPLCRYVTQIKRHPPRTSSMARGAWFMYLRPFRNG